MKVDISKKHTFVVCAYKESQYLEECIQSVLNQNVKSKVIISTGTPNSYIKEIAEKYKLQLFVNPNPSSLASDWNFAMSCAETELITLAHQDDVYFPEYTETLLKEFERSKHPLIFFTDYWELRNGEYVKENKLLKVKRIMLIPLKTRLFFNSRFVRRRILSFGSPICCPSVGYVRANLPNPIFEVGFRSNEDWQAWEKLSKLKGSFIYCKKPLVAHRIHEDSETSAIIADNKRSDEDEVMFSKFWPKFIVEILVKFYAKGQDSNNM